MAERPDRCGSKRQPLARPPRMKDVARLADVGVMTVSRALRNPDKVSATLQARVEVAMEKLSYIPNNVAGSLSSQQNRVVVTIIPSIADSTFANTVQGISEVLANAGYQMLLGNTRYNSDEEESLIRASLGWRPAGLILTGLERSRAIVEMISNAGVPTVELWDYTDRPLDMVVGYSFYRVGWEMTRHLAERGYRRIALVSGVFPHSRRARDRVRDRERGFWDAIREYGLEEPVVLKFAEGPLDMAAGARALGVILDRHPDIEAVFFLGDFPAAGAIFECQRRGVQVPHQMAIAGIGDFEIASQVTPMLTTVRVPRYQIGHRAAEMLMRRLRGEEIEVKAVDMDIEIIQREST